MLYIAIKGLNPSFAIAAIEVTACCSAIATSQKRFGYFSISLSRPVPLGIAAVTPTIFSYFEAKSSKFLEKISVADFLVSLFLTLSPLSISKAPTPCHLACFPSAKA